MAYSKFIQVAAANVTVTVTVTVTVAVAVVALGINFECKRIEDSHTIMAMAPITSNNSPSSVFVIPPTQNEFDAALKAYSMWEKSNGHLGRPCNKLVPIYADGHMGSNAIYGHRCCQQGNNVYEFVSDFKWRDSNQENDYIGFERNPVLKNAFAKSCQTPPMFENQVAIYCLAVKGVDDAVKYAGHSITEPFTCKEIYGMNDWRQIDLTKIDLDLYDHTKFYVPQKTIN